MPSGVRNEPVKEFCKVGDFLKCHSCGTNFENRSKVCPNCGKKVKNLKFIPFLVAIALICTTAFGYVLFQYYSPTDFQKVSKPTQVVDSANVKKKEVEKEIEKSKTEAVIKKKKRLLPANKMSEQVQKDVSKVIDESLEKVVTIYTDTSQGSGFLINDKGDVLTNAHVVEGSFEVTAQDRTDNKYMGIVIGYSNNTDVAVVRVAGLAGKQPLTIETSNNATLGEEVLALGSPLGVRNTATMGYITGVNRSFIVGERSYENIYQMSAHIEDGSSGGPLLSLKTGKAVAINSARLVDDDSVGFSIPIKDIYALISGWIASPLSEEEVYSLFYNDSGNLYYQEETENGNDVYFDGGDYSEKDNSYYEIPEDWYNSSTNEDSSDKEEESTTKEDSNGEDVPSSEKNSNEDDATYNENDDSTIVDEEQDSHIEEDVNENKDDVKESDEGNGY